MTSRQFVNSAICRFFEWFAFGRKFLNYLVIFFFPNFVRIPVHKNWLKPPGWKNVMLSYLFVWFFIFFLQGFFAYLNGRFWPDANPLTKNFLEDTENLIDYLLICGAYCIFGFLFLQYTYTMDDKLKGSNLIKELNYDVTPSVSRHGFLGGILVIFLALTSAMGYAMETKTYSDFYWFMASAPPIVTFGGAGFYYLFINMLLMLFVSWVGFTHLGLFQTAGRIAEGLRNVRASKDKQLLEKWADENKVKKWLEPFSWQILFSKAFVLSLALNMLTWKRNELNVGIMYEMSVLLLAVLGIWVFALPRYFVQYHVFRIRQDVGLQEYKDLRMPWIVGGSAVIDIILISILIKTLLGDAAANMLERFFS